MAVKKPVIKIGSPAAYRAAAVPVPKKPVPKPVAKPVRPAWMDLKTQMKNVFGGTDPYAGEQAAIKYGWTQGLANDRAYQESGGDARWPVGGGGGGDFGGGNGPGGRWVTPDFSGILGSFTADRRARFGAGQAAKQASRLSEAKALVNRLGTKDIGKMVQTLMGFGFDAETAQATAQGAFDNPWSETKATEFTANRAWQGGLANRAARGGFRSGGTMGLREDIDLNRAREEAQLAQGTLEGLSGGLQAQTDWEREERDRMEQDIAAQQASLAAAYQPYWQTEY